MAQLDSVLRHAITPAAFDEGMCHRERLVDTIHANIPRKLIIIAAPPGYGKTSLLANFTDQTELPVCWVRLTEADQDVARFAQVLAASLKRKFRRLREGLDLDHYVGASPEAMVNTFISAIDEQVGETFVIALDDVHLINHSSETCAFLDRFLDLLPEQVTVLAAGREVLEVSLAKLMAEGDLAGLGPHDLALTQNEVIEVARLHSGIELSEDEADELLMETRGWVTGAILSGELAGSNLGALAGNARPMVYEYLASVVLNRQPDDLRRFMLDSSVFPVMTAEACDHVLGNGDSAKHLQALVKKSLFITATNESPRTYEYHPQLRAFLLQLMESADAVRLHQLQSKAADFLAEQGAPEYAVQLYCEAEEASKAAALAEQQAQRMFQAGRWSTLEGWSHQLRELGEKLPRVHSSLAQYYADQGRLDQADEMLALAREMNKGSHRKETAATIEIVSAFIHLHRREHEAALQATERAEELLGSRGNRKRRGDCLRIRALAIASSKGDLSEAEALALESVALLRQTDSDYYLATALIDLSNIQAEIGHASEAQATIKAAHEIFETIGAPLPLAVSYNNLAYNAHVAGDYQSAMKLYANALKFSRQSASVSFEATILFGQADLFSDMDMALQAAELYGQGLNIATEIDNINLIQYGCLQTAALHRRRGGANLAYEWLKRAMSLSEDGTQPLDVHIQMAAIDSGTQPRRAVENMHALMDDYSLSASETTLLHTFLAHAYLESGEIERTRKAFLTALETAGAAGVEQLVAAELQFDDLLMEYVRSTFADNPVLSVVFSRISTMRAIQGQYQKADGDERPSKQIRLRALGEVGIYSGEDPHTYLKPLAREVLFYLADHGDVDRDVMLELFWPHHPPGRQMANLHTAIYSLRRVIGKDAIKHEGTVYSLNTDIPLTYDVVQFERAADIADSLPLGDPRRLFALTEAINSYGGQFLVEFSQDWVLERRRDLEMRYLDLLAAHAEEALIRDQPQRAVATLRQALQIDPLRDDTNLHFMEALGRLGRRSELVDHYQSYMQLLSDELGLDPPEEVRRMYARLID